jgi:uncharacterized protein involved in response to NO
MKCCSVFALAAIAGFLLTAIPNWTGRLPLRGLPLASLAGLWLLGRMAGLVSALERDPVMLKHSRHWRGNWRIRVG